jgi:hypothetical protein
MHHLFLLLFTITENYLQFHYDLQTLKIQAYRMILPKRWLIWKERLVELHCAHYITEANLCFADGWWPNNINWNHVRPAMLYSKQLYGMDSFVRKFVIHVTNTSKKARKSATTHVSYTQVDNLCSVVVAGAQRCKEARAWQPPCRANRCLWSTATEGTNY